MNWYKKILKIAQLNNKTINQISQEIRNKFVYDYDDDYLKALCLPVSRELTKELIKNGYNAKVIQGTFLIDTPNFENYDEEDFENYDEEGSDNSDISLTDILHYWVEVDNDIVVDLTASQFNDELEDLNKMPSIFIGSYSQIDRYSPINKGWEVK
jgi:hypothetical protein